MPGPQKAKRGFTTGRSIVVRGEYVSVQVNVDEFGQNILGDAANGPSIAVDPIAPTKMVIGWQQFDNVESNFRQAGWAYSHDAGTTWTFPGVLEPGVRRGLPVLELDSEGNFYYYSATISNDYCCDVWKSTDDGVTWGAPTFAHGGSWGWMTIDRTGGPSDGHIYTTWTAIYACTTGDFAWSRNGNQSFENPIDVPYVTFYSTMSIDPDGILYMCGYGFDVLRSTDARNEMGAPTFSRRRVNLGGSLVHYSDPNPSGILGRAWIATDHSTGPSRGNVYLLASVRPSPGYEPVDVMFAKSTDGGSTWTDPIRVNDDPDGNGAWHWFGTMSVAPNGRIDAIWNDTRNTGEVNLSELFYSFSEDAGNTWSENIAVSPVFDSHVGWPNQATIGNYYDMVSDDRGVNIAYAATFNGEQDVYYLRIGKPFDCNLNGINDGDDIADGSSLDCNLNDLPDECDPDCNSNKIPDDCDLADQTSPDCDLNSVPDECDPDFDDDQLIDACDEDIDNDGVANDSDACDFTPNGNPVTPDGRQISDADGNCAVDRIDWQFLTFLCGINGPDVAPDPFCRATFDRNDNNTVDLNDVAIIVNEFGGSIAP